MNEFHIFLIVRSTQKTLNHKDQPQETEGSRVPLLFLELVLLLVNVKLKCTQEVAVKLRPSEPHQPPHESFSCNSNIVTYYWYQPHQWYNLRKPTRTEN